MNKKEQLKQQRRRQEDMLLQRALYWIVGAVVLEALLLLLNRYYVKFTTEEIMVAVGLQTALPVLAVIGLALFVICLALAVRRRRGGKQAGIFRGLAAFTLMFCVSCAIARTFYDVGIRFLYVAVPVVAVLALVYYLYQREFFVVAVLSVLGILGVWMSARRAGAMVLVCAYAVVLLAVLVVVLLLGHKLQKTKGVLTVKGKPVALLPKNTNYIMLYVTCGVVAAVVVAALVLGALTLLYGILAAWLLIMAVYYTVRMM